MARETSRLATLFAGPSFSGNYFTIEGIYQECYNVLRSAKVDSLMLEVETSYCEVWGVEECGEEGDGSFPPPFPIFEKIGGFSCWRGLGVLLEGGRRRSLKEDSRRKTRDGRVLG
jgi:hypothetical protein